MTDHKNDDDFTIDDDSFIEEDSWDDEGENFDAPKGKKKSGGLIMVVGCLAVIGVGAYFAKDMLAPILGGNTDAQQNAASSNGNPYAAQNNPQGMDTATPQQNTPSGIPVDDSAQMPPSLNNGNNNMDSASLPMPGETDNMPEDGNNAANPFAANGDASDSDTPFGNSSDPFATNNDQNTEMSSADTSETMPEIDFMDETAQTSPDSADAAANDQNDIYMQAYGDDTTVDNDTETGNIPFSSQEMEMDNNREMANNAVAPNTGSDISTPPTAQTENDFPASSSADMTGNTSMGSSTRVDSLAKRMTDMEADIEQIQAKLDAQNVADLSAQISALSRKIDGMQNRPARAASQSPQPQNTVAAKPSPKQITAAPGKTWVLRSAKQNAAWISEQGQNDIRKITVGETVEGLGTVESITYNRNAGWVVQGDQATLTQ